MTVDEARKLKPGQTVYGSPGNHGHEKGGKMKVTGPISLRKVVKPKKTVDGVEYIWVSTNSGVWSSNRLSLTPWV